MKIDYKKLSFINYLYIVILELLFKIFVMNTIDINIFYIIIFSLPISFIITMLCSLFKSKNINRIISIILWIVIFFIFVSETIYFSFYKTICGLSALMYGGQVMEFINSIMEHVKAHIVLLIGYFIPLLYLIIISIKNKIMFERIKVKESILLFVPTFFMSFTLLQYNRSIGTSAYNLFFNTNDLMESTNTFGIFTSVGLDAVKYLSGFEENISITVNREFVKDDKVEYNITNIDFDELISKEKDGTLKSMHEYFKNQIPTNKNNHTGIFAGKNLIFITAEGFYPIAVDQKYTPTLYKMVNNSFVFNNYYQPIYNCSTSDGEFANMLSILPGVSTCSMKQTIGKYYPYVLGNIFKQYGYNTYAFHGWDYRYYNRDKTHPNFGYEYYGYDKSNRFKNSLKNIKYAWPTSDIEVMNSSYDYYAKDSNFVAYYMSISGHLEYNFGGNAMAKKNQDAVKDLNAKTSIKAYIASQIEFDKSLEILLDNLKRDGILEDTVIVISADHYPYGLTNDDINSYVDWMKNPNFDLYKNNLIIYNEGHKTEVIDKYTYSIDVLPTLLNLFGVKYDSRLLIGNDIFSDSDDLVIFNNKSWITNKGRYDFMKKKFELFEGQTVDDNYVKEINDIVRLKFQMSKLMISKNYYRKVLGD